jgi:nitrite reductase/ring-hydroxylating ferredoxin subunit
MAKHVVAPLSEMPPGTVQRVEVGDRAVAVFNDGGTLYALRDICPHRGARLSDGTVVGSLSAPGPGEYEYDGSRRLIKCPWHAWEFDLVTGQSWCDPARVRVKPYPVSVVSGAALDPPPPEGGPAVPGPYVAETVSIWVDDDDYVVIEV